MFDSILDSVVGALKSAGLNSVRSYPAAKLDRSAEYVCISLKKGEILSSGMGNYLGCRQTEKGVAELYGFKAAVSIAADIYVPASGIGAGRCVALADSLCSALENAPQGLKVLGFDCGDAAFCSESRMFKSRCTVSCIAFPMRSVIRESGEFTDFVLRGELK